MRVAEIQRQVSTGGWGIYSKAMIDYSKEKWLGLYEAALVELRHAKLLMRISDARAGIFARIETLRTIPELHAAEMQAIDNALRALRVLEHEEECHSAEENRISSMSP